MDDYWKLRQQVENHPGFLYQQSRKTHSYSLRIYGGNHRELSALLDFIQTPEKYLGAKLTRQQESELSSELLRFFHNYVASAESLVSHTRSYVRHRHLSDEVGVAYFAKVKETFGSHAPTLVVKDFRNYLLHKGLPKSSILTSFNVDTSEPPTIEVLLRIPELLAWRQWSVLSKKYLEEKGKDLRLSELISDYHNSILAFYRWFDDLLETHHRAEVSAMRILAQEVIAIENRKL